MKSQHSLKKRYVIMCVGHTHTGKTTFAKKLVKSVPGLVLIDTDEIALFAMEKFPTVVRSEYNKVKRDFKEPNFKFLLFKDILDFSMRAQLNIVLSNGNLAKDIRSLVKSYVKKHGYILVTVYFNLPKSKILERIRSTVKSTDYFRTPKNWMEVFKGQEKYAELPPSKEGGLFFEIKGERQGEVKKVIEELLR